MTLFWLAAASLTVLVVALLVTPLLRRPNPVPARAAYDLEVYRDQLTEIERDLGRGLIAREQADGARAEIGRRLLAAADGVEAGSEPPPRSGRRLAWGLLVAIPIAALAGYAAIGRPDLPAQPLASRMTAPATADAVPADVTAAVAHLAERLTQQPDDLDGWTVLAQSLGRMGRLAEAVDAWRHAAALAKDDPEFQGDLAEALIAANQGLVPEEARRLFDGILTKTPDDPRAIHYLAMAAAQAGDYRGALDRWLALAARSPADAPWLPTIRQGIEAMAERLKLNAAAIMPKPLPPQAATPAPDAESQQGAMVRGMVDSLAARLAAQPDDLAGWMRLARSYQVLGESEHRLDALKHAKSLAPSQPDILVAYGEALLEGAPAAQGGAPLPADAVESFQAALAAAPDTAAALWYLGLHAAATGHPAAARPLWQRLLGQLDPKSPDYAEVKARLDQLK